MTELAADSWQYGEALWSIAAGGKGVLHPLAPRDGVSRPQVVAEALDRGECASILRLARDIPFEGRSGIQREGYRAARSHWIPPTADWAWLYERVTAIFVDANQAFGFDIDRLVDPLLVAEYPIGPGFGWHLDTVTGVTSTRKISLSIPLNPGSEYQGGDLEIAPYGVDDNARTLGTAVVFPSFLCHRVMPVTSGVRSALIAWAHGKPFS